MQLIFTSYSFLWLPCPILYLNHHSKGKLVSNYENSIYCCLPCQPLLNVVFISNAQSWKYIYGWAVGCYPFIPKDRWHPHRAGNAGSISLQRPPHMVSLLNTGCMEPATLNRCNRPCVEKKKKTRKNQICVLLSHRHNVPRTDLFIIIILSCPQSKAKLSSLSQNQQSISYWVKHGWFWVPPESATNCSEQGQRDTEGKAPWVVVNRSHTCTKKVPNYQDYISKGRACGTDPFWRAGEKLILALLWFSFQFKQIRV